MNSENPHNLPALPCYLNGEYSTIADAKISVMDRGFIFGDGVYEVVPIYSGKPFRFVQHMARLERSLAELRIVNPLSQGDWASMIQRLVDELQQTKQAENQLVYIQITRGVAMREHSMIEGLKPTVFAMASPMVAPTDLQRSQGVACVCADDFRWEKAHIKSTSLLGAVFARQISVDQNAVETIMFRNGYLSEAAACNVWIAKNGVLYGAPKNNLVLQGIRYDLLEMLCEQAGIEFVLRPITREEVFLADEVLLSSATKEVLPVTLLDNTSVGTGKPGPIYQELWRLYQEAKKTA